ncbi:MAG TPA: DEAD/DEAH box helicase [Bdellovibrionota bacterium]|nr:DEAD/DEAH box helicase [Bdellovibrionota bacterium]
MSTFASLDLLPTLQQTLAEKELVRLTEIQARTLPALLEGRSIVGVAETGSGKTLSYALPVLHRVKELENEGESVTESGSPRAAIIVPTRELGDQVTRVLKPFTHATRLRVRSLLGGTDMDVAKRNVSGPFDILVATPGRLIQLMDRKLVKLGDVRVLVFDEADQMLDQGFFPSATRIASECMPGRQMALFSATVSPKVQELIEKLFTSAEIVRSEGSHQTVSGLKTKNLEVPEGKRFPVLEKYLADAVEGGTMIFTNTREQCDRLASDMKKAGYSSAVYRGEMDKVERRKNLKLFREGKIGFLISTDLASRGLDVEHVGRVINYHLPQQMENYLHRVGRTARAGRSGVVINFVTERDSKLLAKVETLQSRRSAAGKLDSAREWPEEPAHKPKERKVAVVPKGRIVVKRKEGR